MKDRAEAEEKELLKSRPREITDAITNELLKKGKRSESIMQKCRLSQSDQYSMKTD